MGLGADSALDDLIHGGLHGTLGKFYPTAVVIQAVTITARPNGEAVESWSTFLSGLYGNLAWRTAGELRGGTHVRVPVGMSLNLKGHYPTITVLHRAVVTVNGTTAIYNIAAVVHDSLNESTRLDLEDTAH